MTRTNRVGCVTMTLLLAAALCCRGAQEEPKYVPGGDPKKDQPPADEVGLRYVVYDEKTLDYHFAGVMPDGQGVSQTIRYEERPVRGQYCYRARYQLESHPWVAVAALLDGTWAPKRKINVFEKLEARRGDTIVIRFFARSPDKATAQFKVGGMEGDSMDFAVVSDWIQLSPDWKLYQIDLTNQDLSALRGALIWVMDREHNAGGDKKVAEINLDDIYFTRIRKP